MGLRETTRKAHGQSPSSEGGAQIGSDVSGIDDWQFVGITAQFASNTGGNLDVYVQSYDAALDKWIDWVHFPTNAAGGGTVSYRVSPFVAPQAIYAVGTDSSPALAANSFTGGPSGGTVRVWAVSGAGTTAGASVNVSFTGIND